jgi:DDE superfamily endonuclease
VLHRTRRTHTGADVLSFFKWIDAHVERGLDVHVVLDNLSAHKCEAVQKWLAHPKRQRWHLHFTPTSSSWLNLIETWFSILTPQPFVWTKTAQDIIAKVRRGRAALTETATDH